MNFRGDLLQRLRSEGHEVLALAAEEDSRIYETLQSWGIEYRSIPLRRSGMNPYHDFIYLLSLVKLFRQEKPGLLMAYTHKPVIYGSMAAAIAGVPHVAAIITGLGYVFSNTGTIRGKISLRVVQLLYRISMKKIGIVFFQNKDDIQLFHERKLLANRPSIHKLNGSGVSLKKFEFHAFSEEQMEEAQAGRVVFLMMTRLLREKGVHEFAKAARLIRENWPDARFRLIGPQDPSPGAVADEDIQAWVQEGLIEYQPWVDHPLPHYYAAHVFVLPSYREGLPRTSIEAMAVGRPIITADTPGCRDTIRSSAPESLSEAHPVALGENGIKILPRDPHALAVAMSRFLQNPDRIVEMGIRGREFAESSFDVEKVNDQIMEALYAADRNK